MTLASPSADRPRFHFTARRNWINDPNGLVYVDGIYHLYYQHNPEAATFGSPHWGHATSRDLITWDHHPVVLHPDELGLIYSGSAVIDTHNTAGFGEGAIVAAFTHHLESGTERQSLAYSVDGGFSFEKYSGNPVLEPPPDTPDFRDPRVLWWEGNGRAHWVMLLAVGPEIWIYASDDLIHWRPASQFRPTLGSARVFECPDLARVNVEGSDESKWVMTVGVDTGDIPHLYGTRYWIGDFDGFEFTESHQSQHWADHGADFYAVQSWTTAPDNRHIWIGWMNNWSYARVPLTDQWAGVMTIPRDVFISETQDGLRLAQQPVQELADYRHTIFERSGLVVAPGDNPLHAITGFALDIVVNIDLGQSTARSLRLLVRVGENQSTVIAIDLESLTLAVDRTDGGSHPLHGRYAEQRLVELSRGSDMLDLRILVDSTSVEVFADGGLATITEQVYPDPASVGLRLEAAGGQAVIETLEVHEVVGG